MLEPPLRVCEPLPMLEPPLREPPNERVGVEELPDEPLREGVKVLRGTPPSEFLPVEG